ncbi:hypothetical protein GCM10027340_22360 [Marinomonas epiphytica]
MKFTLLLLSLTLTACSLLSEKSMSIHLAMSKKDVLDTLGTPSLRSFYGNEEA